MMYCISLYIYIIIHLISCFVLIFTMYKISTHCDTLYSFFFLAGSTVHYKPWRSPPVVLFLRQCLPASTFIFSRPLSYSIGPSSFWPPFPTCYLHGYEVNICRNVANVKVLIKIEPWNDFSCYVYMDSSVRNR